jgi:hypothetical protein
MSEDVNRVLAQLSDLLEESGESVRAAKVREMMES